MRDVMRQTEIEVFFFFFFGRKEKTCVLAKWKEKTGRGLKKGDRLKYSPHPSKFSDNPFLAMELGKKVSKNMGKMGKENQVEREIDMI
jgi:hypothetical protein